MNEIMAIAGGTWRRILRMRAVYFLILCVLVIIASALRYDVLSINQHKPLMIDVSLVLNTIAAIIVVISVTFEIPKELREGVAATLLTKPLGRTQYLIGKIVGISITAIAICAIIATGFFIIYKLSFDTTLVLSMVQAHLLVMASVIPMASIAVLFSVVLPEIMTPIVTLLVIWGAYSSQMMSKATVIYGGVIPDMDLYNFKSYAVYGDSIAWFYIILVVAWGLIFSTFATSLASLVFGYKDIK